MQDHAALRANGLATPELRFAGMQLNAFNYCSRSSDILRREKAFCEDDFHDNEEGQGASKLRGFGTVGFAAQLVEI